MTKNYAIDLEGVSFGYDNKKTVLENISLKVQQGTFLGLVGPNGSGKSTLIKLILGLLKTKSGDISLFGTPIEKFKDWDKIGFVSQKANSFNTGFPATVFEVVSSGLVKKIGLFRFMNKQHRNKVMEAIEAVDMADFINRNIGELSGGQQQRVFIARALVSDPELLILDEPTVGVDIKNVDSFYNMLGQLNKAKGITMLLVTHDIGTITEQATQVACLNRTLHFHGDADEFEQFNESDLSQFYGHSVHVLSHEHEHSHGGQ